MELVLASILMAAVVTTTVFGTDPQLYPCRGLRQFEKCDCEDYLTYKPYLVRCVRTGFSKTSIQPALSNVPPSVRHLIVIDNFIYELPVNLFGIGHIPQNNIEYLDLSSNNIRTVHGKTFHRVQSVKTLVLDNNDIFINDKVNLFSNFENLEQLSMRNAFNDSLSAAIHYRDLTNVFYATLLDRLHTLDLGSNQLPGQAVSLIQHFSNLKYVSFTHNMIDQPFLHEDWLHTIELLNLSYNALKLLPEKSMQALDKTAKKKNITLDIRNNIIKCTCDGEAFAKWINTTSVHLVGRDELECAEPEELKNRKVTSLLREDFVCVSTRDSSAAGSHRGSIIAFSIVFAILGVLSVIILYMNRDKLKRRAQNVGHFFRMQLGIRPFDGYSSVDPPKV